MAFARKEVERKMFTVNRICKLVGISKATFYQHKEPQERFEEKYQHLKKNLEKVIKKNSAYGIKRIKQALFDKYQIIIGKETLGKLLKIWGLSLKRKINKKKRSVIQKILLALADRANLLIRTRITAPLQAVTSDISEIVFNQGKEKSYLCVHKDVFGQMVYGHALSLTMEAGLVLASHKKMLRYWRKKKLQVSKEILHHSDQGSQYTSYEYTDAVMKVGRLSYSTPGTPTENPGQESFFGRFKDEWKEEINELKNFSEVKKFIQSKIKYYNYQRLHTSIHNQTPYFFTKNSLNF